MDILDLLKNIEGKFVAILLGYICAKARYFFYQYRTKTDFGINRAVKKLRKTLKSNEKTTHLESLFNEKKVENQLKQIIKNDGKWTAFAGELRRAALQNVSEINKYNEEIRLKDGYEILAKEILRIAGRNYEDTYKLDALRQELEKVKHREWIPDKLSLKLTEDEIQVLASIRRNLEFRFGTRFGPSAEGIYNQVRGPSWWGQLLWTLEHLEMVDLCTRPMILMVALFLQHLPACSEHFRGYEEYFADEGERREEFKKAAREWLGNSPASDTLPDKVWSICKASWDRRYFDSLVREGTHDADIEVALCASLIRILNVTTPYSRNDEERKRLRTVLKSVTVEGILAPRHVYTVCLSSLISKVGKEDVSGSIELRPYDNIPKPEAFKYLVEAIEALVDSEMTFIVNCIRKPPQREKAFGELIKRLNSGIKIKWPRVWSQEKWKGPDGAALAESGLEVLANIDKATLSSSEIARRFARGLVVVLSESEEESFSKELWSSVGRLINIARGLRPQLGRVQKIVEKVETLYKKSTPKQVADEIVGYLNKIEGMTTRAAEAAVNEIKRIRKVETEDQCSLDMHKGESEIGGGGEGPKLVVTCFLFGYGGPLWKTIMMLKEYFKLHIITAPLRPVGEGSNLEIVEHFNKDLPKSEGHRIVVIADELIAESMKKGLVFTSDKRERPEFALMGCEAYDQEGNVINSVGCRLVTLAAQSGEVPFYVVTESDKRIEQKAEDVVIGTVEASRFVEGRYPIEWENGKYSWPVAEIVEGKYVTGGIITEDGIVKPKDEGMTCG